LKTGDGGLAAKQQLSTNCLQLLATDAKQVSNQGAMLAVLEKIEKWD